MTKLKTINIKGNDYVTVNERLKHFRENYEGWAILSDILYNKNDMIIIQATIVNTEGIPVAQGIAYEKAGSSFINKTSYIENCETSAWGRALANFGIGIDASVASAQEVKNAVTQQQILGKKEKVIEKIKAHVTKDNSLVEAVKAYTDGKKLIDMSLDEIYNLEAELGLGLSKSKIIAEAAFGADPKSEIGGIV